MFQSYTSFTQNLPGGITPNQQEVIEEVKESLGYMELNSKIGKYIDNTGFELGLKLAIKISKSMNFGFHFSYLFNNNIIIHDTRLINGEQFDASGSLMMQYGGMNFGFPFDIFSGVSIEPDFSLGFGFINKTRSKSIPISDDPNGDWFAYLHPSFSIQYNIDKRFIAGVGFGYFSSYGVELSGLDNGKLSGIRYLMFLKYLL